MPQQRLVIRMTDGTTYESEEVTISDSADKELKKTIEKADNHGGDIDKVRLKNA